jgi:hypothetical protein
MGFEDGGLLELVDAETVLAKSGNAGLKSLLPAASTSRS